MIQLDFKILIYYNYNRGDTLNLINETIEYITSIVSAGGLLFGMFIIVLEAFIPIIPLCALIALNINAFGIIVGTVISWISTCIGSYLAYLVFYHLSNKNIYRHLSTKTRKKIFKAATSFKKISLPNLVILITLPFTPSSLINILSGLTAINKNKFLAAIIIGKFFMVLFWVYVGKSFIESITDIKTIIIISIMVGIAYTISKIVSKRAKIE